MCKIIRLFLVCILLPVLVFGQNEAPKAIIVVGKVLSSQDSAVVKNLFFDGLTAKTVQNNSLATEYFEQILNMDPANDAAMYELALLYSAQNRYSEAEKLMQQAATVNPDNRWYWEFLENMAIKTGNVSLLLSVYKELIRLNPETQEYYFSEAAILANQGKLEEAEALYKAIEKKFGFSNNLKKAQQQMSIKRGKYKKVLAEFKIQIKKDPQNSDNYLLLAALYVQLNNRERAIAILQKGKSKIPKNIAIRLSLADNYRALNRVNDVVAELRNAFANQDINIDEKINILIALLSNETYAPFVGELASILTHAHPQDPKSYAVYGDVLFQEQKYQDASAVYRNAIQLNDQIYTLWEQLLKIDIKLEDFQQLIADGEASLVIFPDQVALYLLTSIACMQTQAYQKVTLYLNKALKLKPEDPEILGQIYSTLGDAYNELGQYQASEDAYEQALSINPANSYVLNNYAYYLSLRENSLEKAEKMSKQAIDLSPNNASYEDTYSWILFKQRKYKEARTWIEKAIENDRDSNAVIIEHYGDILYHLGEKKQALLEWKKAERAGNKSELLQKKIHEKKYID